MSKTRKGSRRPADAPTFSEKFTLQAILAAWGAVPPKSASLSNLRSAVRLLLIKISEGANLDPEVPDTWEALVLPALMSRGVSKKDATDAVVKSSATASGTRGSGQASGGGDVTSLTDAAQDTWVESVSEGWDSLTSGDWGGVADNIKSGWNAFTSLKWW